MDERTLGKRLQLARRRAGLTQQELCQKAGLSYSTLAKIERGAIKSPSVFTVSSIASATNMPLEELLGVEARGNTANVPQNAKKRSKSGVSFVYLDVNGVLVRFYQRAFTEIARDTGESADRIETVFWRYNDDACSGAISLDDFNHAMAAELGLTAFDWDKYYLANVEPIPEIKEFAQWVAQNYEVGLLSNNMPGFIDKLKSQGLIPDLPYKTVVDSSRVGFIKPDPKIYELAQELAAVQPNEILLIDDSRSNLTAADKAGWHVMWFDDFRPGESIEKARSTLAF